MRLHETFSSFVLVLVLTTSTLAAGQIELNTSYQASTSYVAYGCEYGSYLYLSVAFSGDYELYKTDGTATNTSLVKDINSSGSSSPENFIAMNGTLYFEATDGSNGRELWKSDGTSGGTSMVVDIYDSGDGGFENPYVWNSKIYYGGVGSFLSQQELWVSDGTSGGTELLKEIHTNNYSSGAPMDFCEFDGSLYFSANSSSGRELWVTDGTTIGTSIVKDIRSGSSSSSPEHLIDLGTLLVFRAADADSGKEIWRSDGTEIGTYCVKDINSGSGNGIIDTSYMALFDSFIYFGAYTPDDSTELWRTDGTYSGTTLVKEINPSGSSSPNSFVEANDLLFFVATDADGKELWVTDGTEGGTQQVKDINTSGDSSPKYLREVNGLLYFQATDADGDVQVWRSDGTEAGTYAMFDLNSLGSDAARPLASIDNYLLFNGTDETNDCLRSTYVSPTLNIDQNSWQMIGFPVELEGGVGTASDLFLDDFGEAQDGTNWRISRWNSALQTYVRFDELEGDGSDQGDPDSFAPGLGYWVIQDMASTITMRIDDDQVSGVLSEETQESVSLELASDGEYQGQTMLANPFPYTLDLYDSEISSSGYTHSTTSAVSNSIISQWVYTWDSIGEMYNGQEINAADCNINPYQGFWLELLEYTDTWSIKFTPQGYMPAKRGVDDLSERTITDNDADWMLDLHLSSTDGQYRDYFNKIGVGPDQEDGYSNLDASELTPPLSRFAQLYFDHPEWQGAVKRLTVDRRSDDFTSGPKTWDITIRTWRTPNREFELSWPNLAEIDPSYSFTMSNLDEGEPFEVEMRGQNGIRFTTGPHTGDYEYHNFRITITHDGDWVAINPEISPLPTAYSLHHAYPNPFNPTSHIQVALPEHGNLTLAVYNVLGQEVARLADGSYQAGFHKFLLDGSNLGSGNYFIRATVPGKLEQTRKIQLLK
ncbi:T9SS type A sorting domain-containing protein [bacterium]|nr:T9SS type A sorting domain-containing protein [bacterium]